MMSPREPKPPVSLTAAIIAGGKSRRFGSNKALARLGDQRLIDYAIDLAKKVGNKILLNWNDVNPNSISIVPVRDEWEECGPLAGIHAVLSVSETLWVAILPCDMPLLSPEVYRWLWKHRLKNAPVVAVSHRGIEPMVAIWPRRIILSPAFSQLRTAGIFSLHRVLEQLHSHRVNVVEMPGYRNRFFANVNHPQDLQDLQRFIKNRS